VDRKASEEASDVLADMPGNLKVPPLTVTSGNGREFVGRARVAEAFGAGFCFAGAYSSWQRGLNERANGLVRKFLPKGTGFRRVTDGEVKEVQDRLDARPRKPPGFPAPVDFFNRMRAPRI